ncbi:heparinase II/III family protein [Rhizobium sp. SG2393]|uniref:heparinase II/III domain-containing protein n=1 Tax=Rhizobium sp. SG2393 TaxID=3276279 RepID=UPI00366B8914
MLTFPRQTIREGQRFSNFIHEAGTSIIDRCVDIHRQPLIQRVSEPDRDVILPTARLLRDRVVTLAAGDALEGGTRHRRRALKELLAVCAFEDWNPAHFLDTAEMLAAVALGLLWCRSLATPAEQSRLDAAITAKGLQPGAEAFARGDFWVSATHNWNTVCCGALVLGALSLRHGTRRRVADLHPVFAPALAGLRNGFSAFGDDGGYAEGVAYWALAMRAALLAESALLAAGFSDGLPPHLAAGWRFSRDMLAPSGRPFDFGDTPPDWERPDCLGLLASLAADPEAARWHREAPGALTGLDLLWPGPPHRGEPTQSGSGAAAACSLSWYGTAGAGILRAGDWWVGFKGGRNDVNHAHLDLGSFILEWRGQRFAIDAGRDSYALPGYFDNRQRFTYLRTGTRAHNLLVFGGRNQSVDAAAQLAAQEETGAAVALTLEMSDPASPTRWRRMVRATETGVEVTDEVEAKRAEHDGAEAAVIWQLMSRAQATISYGAAYLRMGADSLRLAILEPGNVHWRAEPVETPPGESSNAGMIRLSFVVPRGARRLRVCFTGETSGFGDGRKEAAETRAPDRKGRVA